MSPRAVIAPLAPRINTDTRPATSIQPTAPWPRSRIARPPPAHQAVSVIAPSSSSVLIRWMPPATARSAEVLPATSLKSTSPAPSRLSTTINAREILAPRRARWPFGKARSDQTSITSTRIAEIPLLMR